MSSFITKYVKKIRQIATAASVVAGLTVAGALVQPLLANAMLADPGGSAPSPTPTTCHITDNVKSCPTSTSTSSSSDGTGLCEPNGPINQSCFPHVSFTSPAAGATVSKSVTIGASASVANSTAANKISYIQIKIASTKFSWSISGTAVRVVDFDTTQLANGTYTLSATAHTTTGIISTVTETITVKNTVTKPKPPTSSTSGSSNTSSSSSSSSTGNSGGCTPQDTYPSTNIIYCGLSGSNATDYKNSFKKYYDNKSDGHGHTDIQEVYKASASGYTGAFNSDMFTSGTWVTGTAYKKGTIVVNGTTVATNIQISSRCFSGMSNCQPTSRYHHLTSDVYTRDGTWFFSSDGDSATALVHLNTNGVADFATIKGCGNQLYFKPVVPKQTLTCDALTFTNGGKPVSEDETSVTYGFTATASESNQTNGKMVIDFGDKSNSDTVKIDKSQVSFTTSHKYLKTSIDQSLTAQIMIGVNGLAASTNPKCKLPVSINHTNQKTFACLQLVPGTPSDANGTRTYNFTAKVQGTESTGVVKYQFFFTNTDGSVSSTNATTSNTATGTYSIDAKKVQTGSAYFVATSASGMTTDKTDKNCQFSFSTQLVYTGPGDMIGLVAGTSIIGTLGYQFVLRRRTA